MHRFEVISVEFRGVWDSVNHRYPKRIFDSPAFDRSSEDRRQWAIKALENLYRKEGFEAKDIRRMRKRVIALE